MRGPAAASWTSAIGFCATLFSFVISAYPFVEVVNPRAYAAKILGTTLLSPIQFLGQKRWVHYD